MPVSLLTMPNPRALDDWPEHWNRGIHYVRPLNLGRRIALIILSAVAVGAAIPLGRNKTAKEQEQFLSHIFSIPRRGVIFAGFSGLCLWDLGPLRIIP